MKKLGFIGLLFALTACNEANEIFGYEGYWGDGNNTWSNDVIVMENGYERSYEGPVYVDATSWGSVAYISDMHVNKGLKLLISETDDAEGGKVIDVTSNTITITGLNSTTQYYYCLVMPDGKFKSRIKSVVIPDVSALEMSIEHIGDSVVCTIHDSISSVLIEDKGFILQHDERVKCKVEGPRFAISLSDLREKYQLQGNVFLYAYVQTANAYYRSRESHFSINEDYPDDVNTEEIELSEISEETLEGIDYLKCTVTGYVDSLYFYQGWYDEVASRIYPDKVVPNEDKTVTSFYIKKGFYKNVRMKAFYKYSWDGHVSSYSIENRTSDSSYTPKHFNIRSWEDLLDFISYDREWVTGYSITLLADITVPADMRFSININDLTIEGNGHTLDGFSYFPIFNRVSDSVIKNLKIGTDDAVYHVKKGTNSIDVTSQLTPAYFLTNDSYSYGLTFENCEVRGTFKVSGRNDFYLMYGGGTISGLNDYTKTEYVTITNN